ncbi:MAG: hypothetical protein CK424_01665, partial [Legionella sp.]
LLELRGKAHRAHFVYSGMLFQELACLLSEEGFVSCSLGFGQSSDTLYAMAVGKPCEKKKVNERVSTFNKQVEQYLGHWLPPYMMPQFYEVIEGLPLTSNGKLDRTALPKLTLKKISHNPPTTAMELHLANIWSEVLKLESFIDVSASFFELGGSSLSAMILLGKINTMFDRKLILKDLFENFTIRHLAKKIEHDVKNTWNALVPVNHQDSHKRNLYILPGLIGCSSAYYPLANYLSKHFSVNIIEAKGLYGDIKPHFNGKKMLVDYFDAIKKGAVTKNIVLVGHSAGCLHVVELCKKLEEYHFNVQVILIDGAIFPSDTIQNKIENCDTDALLLTAIKELYGYSGLEYKFQHAESSMLDQIADYLFADEEIDKAYKLRVANGFSHVFQKQISFLNTFKSSYVEPNRAKAIYIASEENKNKEEQINSYLSKFEILESDISEGGHLTMLDRHHASKLADRILQWCQLDVLVEQESSM